ESSGHSSRLTRRFALADSPDSPDSLDSLDFFWVCNLRDVTCVYLGRALKIASGFGECLVRLRMLRALGFVMKTHRASSFDGCRKSSASLSIRLSNCLVRRDAKLPTMLSFKRLAGATNPPSSRFLSGIGDGLRASPQIFSPVPERLKTSCRMSSRKFFCPSATTRPGRAPHLPPGYHVSPSTPATMSCAGR